MRTGFPSLHRSQAFPCHPPAALTRCPARRNSSRAISGHTPADDQGHRRLNASRDTLPELATCRTIEGMTATENAASLLRDLRRQQGRSLRSAAADIGIAPSQLSRLERGQRGLALDISERLSDYYGVPSEIIALAQGEVPPDIVRIFQEHPEELERLRAHYGVQASQ